MPDHLAALQHIRARDFCFGERSQSARSVAEISRMRRAKESSRVTSAAQSLAIIIASVILGISLIVSAAIHS